VDKTAGLRSDHTVILVVFVARLRATCILSLSRSTRIAVCLLRFDDGII
jgi:hypothetical protein